MKPNQILLSPCRPNDIHYDYDDYDGDYETDFASLVTGQQLSEYGYENVLWSYDYGLIYFGPGVKCGGEDMGGENGQLYFFPENLNISYAEYQNGYFGRDQLVPVDDCSVFELFDDALGYSYSGQPIGLTIGGEVK